MAKKAEVKRTRMSDAEVEQFLKRYLKARDLKGKEAETTIRHCAATRWAALERWSKHHTVKAKPKAKKHKKK
jgi:hypothetical protein